MLLEKIYLKNFRSFRSFKKNLGNKNLIFGKNGAGKTSFLESIFFSYKQRSFRTSSINSLINFDSDSFLIETRSLNKKFIYKKEKQKKLLKEIPRENTKLILPMVLDNSSLNFLETPKENRRSFVDYFLFHVKPEYRAAHAQFKKSLAQRNKALKEGGKTDIKTWTNSYVKKSQNIDDLRTEVIMDFLGNFESFLATQNLPNKLRGKFIDVRIGYSSGWENDLLEELRLCYAKDKERGYTSKGPHVSDLSIKIKQTDSGNILSRGEQKLLILLIYIFFCNLNSSKPNNETILLADDLQAELDGSMMDFALEAILAAKAQIFITSLEKMQKDKFDVLIDL